MSEPDDLVAEAVDALRALGLTVEADADFEHWRVDGGAWLTDTELLALAQRLGLADGPGRPQ